ncbi:hypothetical protein LIA77_10887 [Sarocladium implicatum]|nr:hypothetical protein LIA77_10887 [Sarocladium implicatum]
MHVDHDHLHSSPFRVSLLTCSGRATHPDGFIPVKDRVSQDSHVSVIIQESPTFIVSQRLFTTATHVPLFPFSAPAWHHRDLSTRVGPHRREGSLSSHSRLSRKVGSDRLAATLALSILREG